MWESHRFLNSPSKPNQTKAMQISLASLFFKNNDACISSSTFIHFTIYLKMLLESNVRLRTRSSGSASASMQ